jgi:hypothetical protein
VLVGYQDNGSSNNGVSYVLDLSLEALKSIAGVAKEAGVESNVIDVVTQGECDFLSGLVAGSYYYSSATGFLSASVGDYEVGVAKSATNLLMLERITKVNPELMKFIDIMVAKPEFPSFLHANQFDIWKTREVKTTSGTFTVPANTYFLGIACIGSGANGNSATNAGGGGGGLAATVLKVAPGEQISYTISSGIAQCLTMKGNPATGVTAGTASGGQWNRTGGTSNTSVGGGGGLGGNGGPAGAGSYGGGGGGRWLVVSWDPGSSRGYNGGGGIGGDGSSNSSDPAGGGFSGHAVANGSVGGLAGQVSNLATLASKPLGLIVQSDWNLDTIVETNNDYTGLTGGKWGQGGCNNTVGGFGGGGGNGGFGGGGNGKGGTNNGGFGGGGSASGSGGYGGGGGYNNGAGGAAVVVFIY